MYVFGIFVEITCKRGSLRRRCDGAAALASESVETVVQAAIMNQLVSVSSERRFTPIRALIDNSEARRRARRRDLLS